MAHQRRVGGSGTQVNAFVRSLVRSVAASVIAGGLTLAGLAHAQALKMSGDVVKLDASNLQIRTGDNQMVSLKLGDNVRMSERSPADIDRIVPGAFIGTTAAPKADGMLVASEVHIFPESMRGTGEGHRPMDTGPGNTMTNATVSSVVVGQAERKRNSTMTNATVAVVAAGAPERRLTLTYAGGEKVVLVPAATPIVMIAPADRSMLVVGAHVAVYATKQPDGSLAADRITIGKNGFVPPL
jgi:Domain of unknown function (DUF5666)